MSRPVNKVGIYEFGDNVEVEVKNSKTYSRVVLRSDILEMTVGLRLSLQRHQGDGGKRERVMVVKHGR